MNERADLLRRLRSLPRSSLAEQRQQFASIVADSVTFGCTSQEAAAILVVALTRDLPLPDHVTAKMRDMRDVHH